MIKLSLTPRQWLIVAHDLLATAAAIVMSFYIRFEAAGLEARLDKLIPIEARIKQRNASLGKQLSEASESISLNLAEGRRRQHVEGNLAVEGKRRADGRECAHLRMFRRNLDLQMLCLRVVERFV